MIIWLHTLNSSDKKSIRRLKKKNQYTKIIVQILDSSNATSLVIHNYCVQITEDLSHKPLNLHVEVSIVLIHPVNHSKDKPCSKLTVA